ncbi:MAG: 50S ribosomal protein L13 [Candidatus Melainabacteria bacterium]|nr:50S ribosomal protein L13 [Candidatus Melainabacteria bacterium]
MKTYSATFQEMENQRQWWIVDAEGETLGRLASRIANVLRGKNKPQYTPNVDTGDFVVVINAAKIRVSGKKFEQKLYIHHTGYPGGYREFTFRQMMARNPERVIQKAVWGMLPHNTLGRKQLTKLKVYLGADHPHAAQQPQVLPSQQPAAFN